MTTKHRSCGLPLCAAASILVFALAQAAHSQLTFSEQSHDVGLIAMHSPALGYMFSPVLDVSQMLSSGAVGDFNNDGFQDLFVITGGNTPDKLFINNGNGTFTDRAAEWGIALPHLGIGAAVGDYDHDGWQDIYVTSLGPPQGPPSAGKHRLYHNNGNGTFTNMAIPAGVANSGAADGFGPAWGDYDLDGDLDLFIPGWLGGGNRLFRNNNNGTFTQVTVSSGVNGPGVYGFSPRFIDMNGDRYPELLIAADFGTSRYYKNNGNGTFTNFTGQSGTGLDGNGMGQAVGDFNNDGLFDWYVTSVYSINSGMPGVPGTGNMLYMNQGNHTFTETATVCNVNDGGWGWGAVAVDLNHDGWVDLVETNGWWQLNGYNQFEWLNEPSYVFMNNGNGLFTESSQAVNLIETLQGRGMVNFDFDNDGDQDIIIFNYLDELKLFRNMLKGPNCHWLRVFLNTQQNPSLAPNGYGTKLRVTANGHTQRRAIVGGSDYLSQSELSAHFGLADAAVVEELRIDWPDGTATILHDVASDQTLTIHSGYMYDLNGDGHVNVADLLIVFNQWGPVQPKTIADLNGSGQVDLQDLLFVLAHWG